MEFKRKVKIVYDVHKTKLKTSLDEENVKKDYVFDQEISDFVINAFLKKCDFFIQCFMEESHEDPVLLDSIRHLTYKLILPQTTKSVIYLFPAKYLNILSISSTHILQVMTF